MNGALSSDNHLLVPISVEALVVEESRGRWSDLTVDFSRLYEGDILGPLLTPALFARRDCPHKPGVHLHWALPAALRRGGNTLARARRMAKAHSALADRLVNTADAAERGRLAKRLHDLGARLSALTHGDHLAGKRPELVAQLARAGGEVTERKRAAKQLTDLGRLLADLAEGAPPGGPKFPVIPNRWMVHRIYRTSASALAARAWVVESDSRYGYDPEKAASKPDAITVPLVDAPPFFDYVGKTFDYPGWAEGKHEASSIELTALGYGDPAFAAYYPACRSVLGFHDPLSDVPPDTRLGYIVTGWYSDAEKDVLRSCDIEELNWTCAPPDGDAYPSQILCHGTVYDVQWKRKAGLEAKYASKIPFLDDKTCQLAIGNTSTEAMAALLAERLDKPELETLLAAFQDNLLTNDTTNRELDARLHQSGFGSSAGGDHYVLQKKEAEDGHALTATDATPPEGLEQALAELNAQHQTCDRGRRELDADRWEVYATWYRWALAYLDARRNRQDPPAVPTALNDRKTGVQKKDEQLGSDERKRDSQRKDIADRVRNQFSDLKFVASLAPPFWHANDPVVLVSAPGLSPPRAHGRVGRDPAEDELRCRVTGREIKELILDIPNGQSGIHVTPEQINLGCGEAAGPPGGIADLVREALLLDPENAEAIAEQAYLNAKLPTRPRKQDLVDQIKTVQRPSASFSGEPGGKGFPHLGGAFPSRTALRDWDGNPWLPLFLEWEASWQSSYSPSQSPLEHWKLGTDDFDFRPDDGAKAGPGEFTYTGYGIVSPDAAWGLAERLKTQNADGRDKALDQVVAQLGDMNVLAQALAGLHDAFVMRDQILQMPPINPKIFSGNPDESPRDPMRDFTQGMLNLVSPDPQKPFWPIRAGHLNLRSVRVVDAFGQVLEVPAGARLTRASSLATNASASDRLVRCPPRFAQPLRLSFEWIPAGNPPGTYPAGSPVCGWMIPNQLDQNLLFYDGSGAPMGALQKVMRAAGRADENDAAFFWVSLPGTSLKPADIHNPYLRRFVQFLEGMTADTGNAFLSLLDDVLAKTDPGEPEHDPILSVLLGRPLALVRASLKLELEGLPATDQKVGRLDTSGFTKIKFPVRLGEGGNDRDGLVGFFKEDSPAGRPFYAAAGARGPEMPGTIEYRDVHDLLDCEAPVALTLLMDPSAMVHVTTGVLPRRSVELPARVGAAAKSAREAFFQVAPLISPDGDIRMPKPSDDFGKWSWACRPPVTMWKEVDPWKEVDTITAVSDRAAFPAGGQQISEGWLRLKLNPVAILSFWIREGMLEVPENTNVTLAWVRQGGDRLRLLDGNDEDRPLKDWAAPASLPDQYKVQVTRTTTFTLILQDKDGHRAEKRVTVRLKEAGAHA